jgi:hypothetical protein
MIYHSRTDSVINNLVSSRRNILSSIELKFWRDTNKVTSLPPGFWEQTLQFVAFVTEKASFTVLFTQWWKAPVASDKHDLLIINKSQTFVAESWISLITDFPNEQAYN